MNFRLCLACAFALPMIANAEVAGKVASESRDAATAYILTQNFIVGRTARECFPDLGRTDTTKEFVVLWQHANAKYFSAAISYMNRRLGEAETLGGQKARDDVATALKSAINFGGTGAVNDFFKKDEKHEACKKVVGLMDAGAFNIDARSPMYGELQALVQYVEGQSTSFNRYTDDLPQLLETDAATVMARGMTLEFAVQICNRLGGQVAATIETDATEWRKRNDVYLRGASAVFNEIGDRYLPVGGEQAKQGYLQSVLLTTTKATNQQLMKQLNGATLDNSVLPSEAACKGLSRMLHDGVGDFKNTPEVTRALVFYMRRKNIQ